MGNAILISGFSGTGKSSSLRNFKKGEVGVFSVAGKRLPFRTNIPTVNCRDYSRIKAMMSKAKCNTLVIDDSQYLMAFDNINKADIKGFDKFTQMGVSMVDIVDYVNMVLPEDYMVYFLHHLEETDSGRVKAKTLGKMIDNQITFEGLFNIVINTEVTKDGYFFRTKTKGNDCIKTPMGMFESDLIENDLKMVDSIIRDYYFGEIDETITGNN